MAEFMAIEVAEYIERGLEFSAHRSRGIALAVETPHAFLDFTGRGYRAGALGLALLGKTSNPQKAYQEWLQVSNTSAAGRFAAAAELLGIPVGLARLVELNHQNGVPAAEIASGLRTGTLGLSFRNRPVVRPEPAVRENERERDVPFVPAFRIHA